MLQHLGADKEVEGTGGGQGGLFGQHRKAAGGDSGLDPLDAGLKTHRDEFAAGQQGTVAVAEQPQGARVLSWATRRIKAAANSSSIWR